MEELRGRVAIVTGGSRGIGLACASLLARRGARVVLTSRDQAGSERAAAGIPGGRAIGVAADALDEDAARACVDTTIEQFGSIDILVNNVGIGSPHGPLVDLDRAGFSRTIDTNLWAPIFWSGLVWHAWMHEHGGSIVNVSSQSALETTKNIAIYSVSKDALLHVTRDQALELAPKVRVNAVAPGIVKTELSEPYLRDNADAVIAGTPLGRLGEPDDVAEAVAFLVSDAAAWITGETILMDGGAILAGKAPGT
jgi:NAD(P)-dependent dehydrogenase (short-subunit alcohol dehydrogenase family)